MAETAQQSPPPAPSGAPPAPNGAPPAPDGASPASANQAPVLRPPPPRRIKRQRFWGTRPGDDEAADPWLMSYADMVTLLMTAFVILVLLAAPTGTKGDGGPDKASGIRGFLNNIFELRAMSPYADENDYLVVGREGAIGSLTPEQRAGLAVVKKQDLDQIRRRLETLDQLRLELEKARLNDYVKIEPSDEGIRVDLPNPIIFGTGAADIDGKSMLLLRALIPILSIGEFQIVVEGHTDNAPVADPTRYPTNWELSAARAATVVRILIDAGIEPQRLTVAGYADTRPILKNDTEERRAQNRRITFLLKY